MKQLSPNVPLIYIFSRFYHDVKSKSGTLKRTLILLSTLTGKKSLDVILADDDEDDRVLFIEAIHEIAPQVKVRIAVNGEELMNLLRGKSTVPDIIFLDLNMPLKNGHECLAEIRSDKKLSDIPVIIYSTSSSREHIDETFKKGANFYIAKPDSFNDLKLIAKKILSLDWEKHVRPQKEKFVIRASQL